MSNLSKLRNRELLPYQARQARREERLKQVLGFLREEIWSASDILGIVMGIKTPQGIHKALTALEIENVISRSSLKIYGRRAMTIWGITPHGQALAFNLQTNEKPENNYFEPSRISLSTLDHHLDIQRLRLKAEAAGWKNWLPGTRLGKSVLNGKRPDAVALTPNNQIVALEIERTVKTTKRYEAIISNYLQAIKNGDYSRVQYLCPTVNLAARLQRIFTSIKAVPVNGRRVGLQEHHYQSFQFTDYIGWKL